MDKNKKESANPILVELEAMKEKITLLGHEHLQKLMPIRMSRFHDETQPFVILEKAFDEAIKEFEYNLARMH